MALLTRNEVHNVTDLLTMDIKGWCAWDKRRGIHVFRSHGRRMTGRPKRYVAIIPLEYKEAYDTRFANPNVKTLVDWKRVGVTADSDEEARDKIIKRIRREI